MGRVSFDFTGDNYVVTGASSGMGQDIAIELAKAGANILAIARNEGRLLALKEQYPERISVASLDVCDFESMDRTLKEYVGEKGKLKGGVHAAGIDGMTPLRSFDRNLAKQIMDISFWGGINLSQAVNKKRHSVDGASTVLFSSIASITGEKCMFGYSASKAALNTAVKSIAKEIADSGKRINTILPGWVKTNMTDKASEFVNISDSIFNQHLLGIGSPHDVTPLVLFLLSDSSKWITGTNIVIDGGYLAGGE